MMLAAMRAGSAAALFDELSFSQKEMLAQFKQQLPMMPAKAYRWVAEMREIAGFVGDDPAAHELYEGLRIFTNASRKTFPRTRRPSRRSKSFWQKPRLSDAHSSCGQVQRTLGRGKACPPIGSARRVALGGLADSAAGRFPRRNTVHEPSPLPQPVYLKFVAILSSLIAANPIGSARR